MLRLENPEMLYLFLALIPVLLAFLWFMFWRASALQRFADNKLLEQLAFDKPRHKYQIKFILISLAIASLVIAAANPQIGTKIEKVKRQGVDLIVALDVSRSMLAEDIKPNRISRSKLFISKLIDNLQSDRIGLIVFAGNAYLQMPLTIDYSAGKLFLNTLSTDMVPKQGTAIGESVRLAMESFETGKEKNKALLIISDGEDHEGDALEAIADATKAGIVIHTLGVGSAKGAPIPVSENTPGKYKRDKEGNIVLSKLNETMMQKIALEGNGKYFRLSSGNDGLEGILQEISTMEKKDFDEQIITDYEDQFQYFVAFALFLLTMEFFISNRRSHWITRLNLFGNQTHKEAA